MHCGPVALRVSTLWTIALQEGALQEGALQEGALQEGTLWASALQALLLHMLHMLHLLVAEPGGNFFYGLASALAALQSTRR